MIFFCFSWSWPSKIWVSWSPVPFSVSFIHHILFLKPCPHGMTTRVFGEEANINYCKCTYLRFYTLLLQSPTNLSLLLMHRDNKQIDFKMPPIIHNRIHQNGHMCQTQLWINNQARMSTIRIQSGCIGEVVSSHTLGAQKTLSCKQ